MTSTSVAELQARRDKAVIETDALQSEIDLCISQFRKVTLLRRMEELVREIDQIDAALTRRKRS